MIPMGPRAILLGILLSAFQAMRRHLRITPWALLRPFPGRLGLRSEAQVIETTLIVYTSELRCNTELSAMKVPLLDLKAEYAGLRDEILPALERVCQNSSFVLGPEVEAFEREFADFCGTKHCVALSTGTAALHLGLLALGVQTDDEVITTRTRSSPLPRPSPTAAPSRSSSISIPPPAIWIRSSSNAPSPRAPARSSRSTSTAARRTWTRSAKSAPRHNIRILEDAAQAHGARYRGRRVGGLGHAAAFSFYPTKNLGAYGEGGALTTDDDQIAKFVRAARNHGQTARYEHEFVGYNYRMQGFQGAVLRIKLRHLYAWTQTPPGNRARISQAHSPARASNSPSTIRATSAFTTNS